MLDITFKSRVLKLILNSKLEASGYNTESVKGHPLLERLNSMFNQHEHLLHLPSSDTKYYEPFKYSYNPYASVYLELRNEIGKELGRIHTTGLI